MEAPNLSHLTQENLRLVGLTRDFETRVNEQPENYWPFWFPCQVRVLLVVDQLNFSETNFGLSTFVRALLDIPGSHVRFRITLAHIMSASDTQMMAKESRIVNRITNFKFDDPSHFAVDMYDEVFLFGFREGVIDRGVASNNLNYPIEWLAEPELQVLTEFVNAGGGLFATGDHGQLGRFLCQRVPRARNMRLWRSTPGQNQLDRVSMAQALRNDTNRPGSGSNTRFDDESDDTPQDIQPRLYQSRFIFMESFPHPLLCSPRGIIRVLPDHPHEGECIEPDDPDQSLEFGGVDLGREFPDAVDGGVRPLPEVIATSTVLSNITSGRKDPTLAQQFGAITAYDGHRAGIGRVVTDATWHHFINLNLIGDIDLHETNPKRHGFLYSASGQMHLEEIKTYYRNLGVWMARPAQIRCMNTRLLWKLVWQDRVMEAVLSTTNIRLDQIEPHIFRIIGHHARDVLGRSAGQCVAGRVINDVVLKPAIPALIPDIDPWFPSPEREPLPDDGISWFDGSPLLDMALGGGLVALREAFPQPDERLVAELETEQVEEVVARGGAVGVETAFRSLTNAADVIRERFQGGQQQS